MKMRAFLSFLLCGVTASSFAQVDLNSVPAPRSPLVAAPPENGAWVINIRSNKPKGEENGADASPVPKRRRTANMVRVESTKLGQLKRDELTLADGSKSQYWYVDGSIFLAQYANGKIGSASIGSDWDITSLSTPFAFAGCSWIDLKNYDRVVLFDKIPAYHYKKQTEEGATLEAWIDVKTNRPLAFNNGNQIYVFSFDSGTPLPLVLPLGLQQEKESMQKEASRRKQLEMGAVN